MRKQEDLGTESEAHSYTAPTRGRCVDEDGLEVRHIWRTELNSADECQKECDNRGHCQAYAYHIERAACNLYGAHLQADPPRWDEGMPTSTNCPVHGALVSTLDADKVWTCRTKAEAIYVKMAYGKGGCPPGRDIATIEDCKVAVSALGFPLETIYNGSSPKMPCHCSIRGGESYNGEYLNWNVAATCKARMDMAPVCVQARDGCTWRRR